MKRPLIIMTAFVLMVITAVCASAAKAIPVTFAYSDVESFPDTIGTGPEPAEPPGISCEIITHAAFLYSYCAKS